ncbi:MAG TPA: DUF721 domain-containing protein [bacterium]|nr:DUF721 domain-containing protein [bacterium]
MRQSALTSLRAILRSAAAAWGVERAAHEAMIVEMWAEVVGADSAAHSKPAGLRGTTLLVNSDPGLWVQELSARRGRFADEINRRLGARVVTDIRIRPQANTTSSPLATAAGTVRVEAELSAEEQGAIERAVAEIADPALRETARKVMGDQMRWRKRQAAASPADR